MAPRHSLLSLAVLPVCGLTRCTCPHARQVTPSKTYPAPLGSWSGTQPCTRKLVEGQRYRNVFMPSNVGVGREGAIQGISVPLQPRPRGCDNRQSAGLAAGSMVPAWVGRWGDVAEPNQPPEGCLTLRGKAECPVMPSPHALAEMFILLAIMALAGLWFWKALQ